MPRLAVVSVHYYPQHGRRALQVLQDIVTQAAAQRCEVVNNNPALQAQLARQCAQIGLAAEVLAHDNSGSEFGAYQLGLDRARKAGDFDWVVFVNDTLATHQSFCSLYRNALVARLQAGADERPVAIGRIWALPRPFAIGGARTRRWITTNLFALNRGAIALLHGRVHHPELDALVRESADVQTFFAPELDDTLARHVKAWLFGALPGPRWHSAAPLSASNAAAFARKARAILQEKYLAACLEEGGCHFHDMSPTGTMARARCRGERLLFDLGRLALPSR